MTLHDIAPILAVILDERRLYERLADEHEAAGEQSAAMLARSKAQVINVTLGRVIEAATTETSHV